MKTILKTLGICTAIAAIASSCAKEIEAPQAPDNEKEIINLTIHASSKDGQAGKTYIDGNGVKWASSGERIKLYEYTTYNDPDDPVAVDAAASQEGTTTDGGVTMSFSASTYAVNAESYTYYGVYPAAAHISVPATALTPVLRTPSTQTSSATSFDPNADLLISAPVGPSQSYETEFDMSFARAVSIAKMTLTNLPSGATISSVAFSANNGTPVTLAGQTTYNLATGDPVSNYGDVQADTSIVVNTTSATVYFTSYPFALGEGDKFKVVATTSAGVLTREVTIPSGKNLNFRVGKAAVFSVDMTNATLPPAASWTRYSGELTPGDYVIVYEGRAMKAAVSSNRLAFEQVTESGNHITNPDASIVWRISASGNYWTIYNPGTSKYAASTGANNKAQLLSSGTDDMSLWTVSVDEGLYDFVNKYNYANGKNANLRCNDDLGFACYAASFNTPLTLYKKTTTTKLAAPASVSASLDPDDASVINVSFSAVQNAGSYTIVATPVSGSVVNKTVSGSPATISISDGLSPNTTYTISVIAVPSDDISYANSDPAQASASVTVGSLPVAGLGTVLWQEDFGGWTSLETSASGGEHVYGGGSVSYLFDRATLSSTNSAAGASPEIQLAANEGYMAVSGIPVNGISAVTLFLNSESDVCEVMEVDNNGLTITPKAYGAVGPKIKAFEISDLSAQQTLGLFISNGNDTGTCKVDNIVVKAGTKSFRSMAFASASVSWTIGSDCTLNTARNGVTLSGALDGVSYSSSNPNVATVDASTGAVTPKAAGSVTISASVAESDSHWAAVAQYTLNIINAGPLLSWSRSGGTNNVTDGYTFYCQAEQKSDYYQDGSGTTRYVEAYRSTPIFSSTPTSVTVKATLGGGTAKADLTNSVYACYVDASGNDIANSSVLLTDAITSAGGSEFSASMSTALATSACGIKIYHVKETGYNVRYYAFSLEASGAGGGGGGTGTATASVTTGSASSVTAATAVLAGSFSGATGTIYECGFYWGTSSTSLGSKIDTDGSNASSGNFSCSLGSLSASTTYYYKAYVLEWNATAGLYEERFGSVRSFTTSANGGGGGGAQPTGWLELPAVTGNEDYLGLFYGDGQHVGTNRDYSYNYSYTWYASMWVAYPLCEAHTSGSGGSKNWNYNPNIAEEYQISITSNSYGSQYNQSDYARGHQIPNADRKCSATMNGHTYLATNQTPQRQNRFNGSIWGNLEGAVRGAIPSGDTLYVVTGPCYRKVGGSEDITYFSAAKSGVHPASLPVPNYYWKAVLKVKRGAGGTITSAKACGFWFDHRDYVSGETYDQFAVSVDQIEARTGLDLFTNLPASLQTSAESNSSWSAFTAF